MRFLYLSRAFNRSGYYILQHLLREKKFVPITVILPKSAEGNLLDNRQTIERETEHYREECRHYGCSPIRFLKSIRLLAEENMIPVHYIKDIKNVESYELIKSLNPDLIVLGGGWPQLLPVSLIRLPRLGIINTHPSLLPAFRGADVHRWQVYAGVSRSGTTIHYVDEMFDTGSIIAQSEMSVPHDLIPQMLADQLGRDAGCLMDQVLSEISASDPIRLSGKTQADRYNQSQYFSRWKWEDPAFMKIDWQNSAGDLSRFVRACTQESFRYNGPFFFNGNKAYILRLADLISYETRGLPGEVISCDPHGIIVCCGSHEQLLRMTMVQPVEMADWVSFNHRQPALSADKLAKNALFKKGDILK